MLRHGTQLANRLHEIGVEWWDSQLEEYEPLPEYVRFPDIWTDHVPILDTDPDDYGLTSRSMRYFTGAPMWAYRLSTKWRKILQVIKA